MIFRRQRLRRRIALIALLGLLFQQLAIAGACPLCPLERGGMASVAAESMMPPAHMHHPADKARCQQHCHPQAQTSDHETAPTVPPVVLPATSWLRQFATAGMDSLQPAASATDARATAPPLNIQHCSLQI